MNYYKLHYDRKTAVVPAADDEDARQQLQKYNSHIMIHRLEQTDENNFIQDLAGKRPDIWQAIAIARAIRAAGERAGGRDNEVFSHSDH